MEIETGDEFVIDLMFPRNIVHHVMHKSSTISSLCFLLKSGQKLLEKLEIQQIVVFLVDD